MDTELNLSGMEEADYLAALLLKQLRQEITAEELQYLENWKAAHPAHARVYEQVNDSEQLLADLQAMKAIDMDGWWQKISAQITPVKRTVPFYKRWYAYAAAAMVLLAAGALTWQYWEPKQLPGPANEKYVPAVVDVPPGGNKATLTLSNGAIIDVGSAANGTLAKEGKVQVVKVKDGELKYEGAGDINGSQELIWNTLSTPRGGQYSLVLPDGSKVWLNAASSIKFPAHFSAAERRVFVTGEVYFEVATLSGNKGTKRPFSVIIPPRPVALGEEVEVLGTNFNIMAYDDEADIKTTLLNGKLKVSALQSPPGENNASKLLAPGQQAQIPHTAIANKDAIKIVDLEDVEDALGWKNGLVSFENADIRSIMRMIARWYNVEVAYEGQAPPYKFTGKLPLKENLSAVIKLLEYEGVRFKVQQNKIIVLP
jgi:ferric-dicitrate binding protein FerR (iron transport regulator)